MPNATDDKDMCNKILERVHTHPLLKYEIKFYGYAREITSNATSNCQDMYLHDSTPCFFMIICVTNYMHLTIRQKILNL